MLYMITNFHLEKCYMEYILVVLAINAVQSVNCKYVHEIIY